MELKRPWAAVIFCTNVVFVVSGFGLWYLGGQLLGDSERILLSRLLGESDIQPEHPLFVYLACLMIGVAIIIVLFGIVEFPAIYIFDSCIPIIYVSVILLLIVGEIVLCVVAVFWSDFLGIDVKPSRLVRALQRNYAVPGKEQFTAAIDLAQTKFFCCGINGSNNYGTSWWRIQEITRRELVVPLSCCTLANYYDDQAYLNPEPSNVTLCQALNPSEHQKARHTRGCLDSIESWMDDQVLLLLAIGIVILFVELTAVLTTLIARSKRKVSTKSQASTFTSTQTLAPFSENDHDYGSSIGVENRMQMSGMTFGAKS